MEEGQSKAFIPPSPAEESKSTGAPGLKRQHELEAHRPRLPLTKVRRTSDYGWGGS